jgi:hypothetical protein
MKPIIIKSDKITKALSIFISVGAITLFPFIILRSDYDNPTTINHEKIHIEQQRELFVIFFYILYVFYWTKGKVQGMSNDDAYFNIPFEKEAYQKMHDENYLETRENHAWKNYI